MSRFLLHLISLALLVFFALFLVSPLVSVVRDGFYENGQFTTVYIQAVFANPIYRMGLLNSLYLAICTTLLVTLISVPLALLSARYEFVGKRMFSALLLVPMILPPFVGAIGLRQILGRFGGSLNLLLQRLGVLSPEQFIDWLGEGRFWGVVVLEALHLYPIMYLNLSAALANIDPVMEEAGRNAGASGWTLFRRITLPLIMPGLFAGGTIVFIWSFTELGTPLMLDYRHVTAVQIFEGIKEIGTNSLPFALAVVMLGASITLYLVGKVILGHGGAAMTGKATIASTHVRLGPIKSACVLSPFILVTALAILPHIGVVLTSVAERWQGTVLPHPFTGQHYLGALSHSLTVPSIVNSMKYAAVATLLDLVVGLLVGYLLVRTRIWSRHLLDALAMLPLAVPGLVMAFGYLAITQEGSVLDSAGLIGQSVRQWLDPRIDPTGLLIIAYAVRRLPYVVRSAAAGLQQTSVTLEEAAWNLGASPLKTLRRITVPLIAANLIAGGLLAFSFAMLEVSDSLVLAFKEMDYPITKAIYSLYERLGDGPYIASALGVWAMVLLTITIIAASMLLGKRLGALFRI